MPRASRRVVSALSVACLAGTLVLAPADAQAQIYETVGIRAQGLGGAFVAVADDATATWWNPAALASGPYFSAVLEASSRSATPATPAAWAGGFAVSFPALGLSYYRLSLSGIRNVGAKELAPPDREDVGALSVFGATLGQSLTDHLVVASTLKLARGAGDTNVDLDAGALVNTDRARFGIVVKNLGAPTFGSGASAVTLSREVRAGTELIARSATGQRLIVALDADLTRVGTMAGDERHVALGAEFSTAGSRFAVRGGGSANTVGSPRAAASLGLSAAIHRRVFVDGQLTKGDDEARRGWGVGLRWAF